jgi:hypothetical protein
MNPPCSSQGFLDERCNPFAEHVGGGLQVGSRNERENTVIGDPAAALEWAMDQRHKTIPEVSNAIDLQFGINNTTELKGLHWICAA